jgi:hypothetical protein
VEDDDDDDDAAADGEEDPHSWLTEEVVDDDDDDDDDVGDAPTPGTPVPSWVITADGLQAIKASALLLYAATTASRALETVAAQLTSDLLKFLRGVGMPSTAAGRSWRARRRRARLKSGGSFSWRTRARARSC